MPRSVTSRLRSMLGACGLLLVGSCADAPRLVVEDPATGFALYRSGRLSATGLGRLCAHGVEELLVLDGDATPRECAWRESMCPGLEVRYNRKQDPDRPLSIGFLHAFDAWIESARADGRKVAFRCRHGWHRAGRLAAYYRLRFEGVSVDAAVGEMNGIGRWMWLHPSLADQVAAYEDLIGRRSCSTAPESCPVETPDPALAGELFADDVCTAPPRVGA